MADTGWPSDDDLADYLGGIAVDNHVVTANAAAKARAVAVAGLDPATGVRNADEWLAVLDIGGALHRNRNRPDGPDAMYPSSTPYVIRIALQTLMRGKLPIA